MSTNTPPPLPLPDALRLVEGDVIESFNAEQMREYGEECARAALDAAARAPVVMIATAASGDLLVRIGDGPWQRFRAGAQVEIVDGQAVEWKETGGGGFRR